MLSPSHVLPRFVSHEIRRHREQPGPLVLYRSLSQCAHERLLCNFFSPVAISQTPCQVSHQRGVVSSEESLYVGHTITSDPLSKPGRGPSGSLLPTESARSPCCARPPAPAHQPRTARAGPAPTPAA